MQLAVIELVASNNKLETLRPLIPKALVSLRTVQVGDIMEIGADLT